MPVIEPISPSSGERGREARSRVGLAIDYLKVHRRPAGIALLVAVIIGTATALLLPSTYTARASFYSEGKQAGDLSSMSALGPLAGLLSMAGTSLGGNQSGFFVDLLKSQAFFDTLAVSPIPVSTDGKLVLVRDFVVKKASSEGDRSWKARIALRKMIDVSTQPSGVVVVRVDAKSPVAAAAMANRAVDVIDNLNLRFRREQAASRRKFTQDFLADVETRLSASEDRLQDFLLSNRSLISMRSSQSPVLQRQEERLRGETTRLTSLKEQLESTIENARLTEFNDAPVVARVDRAPVPEKRSGPPRTLIALGSILLAATLIFWVAFIKARRVESW
jgi:uncharacterized protein involved in exopolysaccharide biosynthesis